MKEVLFGKFNIHRREDLSGCTTNDLIALIPSRKCSIKVPTKLRIFFFNKVNDCAPNILIKAMGKFVNDGWDGSKI